MARVAVLGIGAMGSRMARKLIEAGHSIAVWNRTAAACAPLVEAGAWLAQTPSMAVEQVDYAISMIRDDEASAAVWLDPQTGALAAMPPHAVGIESSTLTTAWVRSLSGRFEAAGIAFRDAPVAGSRPQAEAANLIYLVGGHANVLAGAEPILRAMGAAVHHVGPAGGGTTLKLAINAFFGVQVAALAEIIGLLGKAGIDFAHAIDIVAATPVCSPAAKGAAVSMLSGAFAAQLPVNLVAKDFDYALSTAETANAVMPITAAARAVFARGLCEGIGSDNLTSVVRLYR